VYVHNIEYACFHGLWLQILVFKAGFFYVSVYRFLDVTVAFRFPVANLLFAFIVLPILSLSLRPGFFLSI
jgi:hypothetical protein